MTLLLCPAIRKSYPRKMVWFVNMIIFGLSIKLLKVVSLYSNHKQLNENPTAILYMFRPVESHVIIIEDLVRPTPWSLMFDIWIFSTRRKSLLKRFQKKRERSLNNSMINMLSNWKKKKKRETFHFSSFQY